MAYGWLIWCLIGYLCGSISFALLLGRLRGVDIRKAGSGNVGATNVGRVLGRKWGFLCFGLDVLKGFGPVFGAGLALGYIGAGGSLTTGNAWRWLPVMVCPVLGHVFPVWLKFKGGKGVATGFGVLLGVWPVLTLAAAGALVVWIIIAKTFRYVGLASAVAAMSLPGFVLLGGVVREVPVADQVPFLTVTGLLALLVLIRHRGNLARTFKGTEPKIGKKVQSPESRVQSPES
jgi:acyl phosphate:glycerol-3-phosphate acyltransferase